MVALIVLGGLGLMMGPCSVLGIYGVRKYLANAKTAEARNTVGHLARLAVAAYERDRRLCPSARHPVPSNTDKIRGVKYQAARGEWTNDAPSRAGFACLGFEMAGSQYYQYDYRADGRSFTVTARGDLDGDGELSTFKISGQLLGEDLVVTPSIEETSPEE